MKQSIEKSALRRIQLLRDKGLALSPKASSVVSTFARYIVGMVFVASGWTKLWSPSAAISAFDASGIPAATFVAPAVATVEVACGALLLLGLATRLATLPLVVIALASLLARGATGFVGFVASAELAYAALLLFVFAVGPGAFAVDTWLAFSFERAVRERASTPAAADRAATPPRHPQPHPA